jgi:hypothetical protein
MTPSQKAKEIFSKFYAINCSVVDAIECSNYLIDNVIAECKNGTEWWEDVKKIINDEKELAKLI